MPQKTDITSRNSWHRPDIQGLRAVAVLMVVAFHSGLPIPGGFTGVDAFFVISGYVITGMLNREWEGSGRISLGRFYLRRSLRLIPALALVILVTLAMSGLILPPLGQQQAAAETAIFALLFAANYRIAQVTGDYFAAPAETEPFLNIWSLSVEEQFYFFFPLLLVISWLLARRGSSWRMLPFILIILVIQCSLWLAIVGESVNFPEKSQWLSGFYSPLTRAWEFGVGSLLVLCSTWWRRISFMIATILAILGSAILLIGLWLISDQTTFSSWLVMPTVMGTSLLIIAGEQPTNPVSALLSSRGLEWVGDRSYSIYLWHWPLIVFASMIWPTSPWSAPLAAVTSLIPALLSYTFVENPLRKRYHLPVWRALWPALGFMAITTASSIILRQIADNYWLPMMQQLKHELRGPSAYRKPGCDMGKENDEFRVCKWHQGAPGEPVYLIGDSNAAHFESGMILAAKQSNQPLALATARGCQPIRSDAEERCRNFYAHFTDWLSRSADGHVILAMSDSAWLLTDNEAVTPREQRRLNMLENELIETVRLLESFGHKVSVFQTLPHFLGNYKWSPDSCPLFKILNQSCKVEMPLSYARNRQAAVYNVIEEVGKKTGAMIVDLADSVCPGGMCRSADGGKFNYRDAKHITNDQSARLAPQLLEILKAANRH